MEPSSATAEEYWPDMEGLDYRDTVTDWDLPPGTFFDLALVHVLTTATLERLREIYPQGRFEVRRFRRPNIVVASESRASSRTIGSVTLWRSVVRFACRSPVRALAA